MQVTCNNDPSLIITVLMTPMEQLRPLLTVENPGAKKIVAKMITSIKELLDDIMELQTHDSPLYRLPTVNYCISIIPQLHSEHFKY